MKRWMTVLLVGVTLFATTAALAATDQENALDDATTVVRQFVDIPENAIPPTLLREAYGIAVIPGVLKIGFIFGGRRGSGVLSVRTQDGSWSNPVFVSLTGGSVGWQIGASSTDVILVFKSQRSVDRIASGQISLGADAAVAAGPVGRAAGAATDLGLNAEVYSYSRSRGVFAGVSLEGGRIGISQDANWLFYDQAGIAARTILRNSDESTLPPAGERFVYTLDRYMPPAENYNPNARSGEPGSNAGAPGSDDPYSEGGQAVPYEAGQGVTIEQSNDDAGPDDGNAGSYGAGTGNNANRGLQQNGDD